MINSKKIQIDAPLESRIKFLLNDYRYLCKNPDLFNPLLNGLKNRLDKNLVNDWKSLIKNKKWKDLTESLLTNHYDPSYTNNNIQKNQKIVKTIKVKLLDKNSILKTADEILKIYP